MQIGAKAAGFKILGNIEWRPYYHYRDEQGRNTWEENFGCPIWDSIDKVPVETLEQWQKDGVDLVMGHPECGNFSRLKTDKNRGRGKSFADPADLPLFADLVARIRPRFFVMDNLGPSLIAFPIEKWKEKLPDYDLFPEWVSNYNYGNSQKNRRRFFMIGALKSEKFTFVPGEEENDMTLIDAIGSLPDKDDLPEINHIHHPSNREVRGWPVYYFCDYPGYDKIKDKKLTLSNFKKMLRSVPPSKNLPYTNKSGEPKHRPGYCIVRMGRPAPVQSGGGLSAFDNHYREDTLNPLTIRERARIQGCPDDFIFYPTNYYDGPTKGYVALIKQTGKFMPVQFCTFIAEQIYAHCRGGKLKDGRKFKASGKRLVNMNEHIQANKQRYCREAESVRPEVCDNCWMDRGSCLDHPDNQ